MSFNNRVKEELQTLPFDDRLAFAELLSFFRANASIQFTLKGYSLLFQTENNPLVRRLFRLIKKIFHYDAMITVHKSTVLRKNNIYLLKVKEEITEKFFQKIQLTGDIFQYMERDVDDDCFFSTSREKSAYLRAAFMINGYIYDPNKRYQLEIKANHLNYLQYLQKILSKYSLKSNIITRNETYLLYVKESEMISDLLSLIGAHRAVLDFENIRVYKDIKNDVNRRVNFDTANVNRTVSASSNLVEMIKYIDEKLGLENLEDSLQEVARLRLENRESSLKEIGEMTQPPISKSGVNYRIRKLRKIYESLI